MSAISPALLIPLAAVAILFPGCAAAKTASPKTGGGLGGVELRKLGEFTAPTYVEDAPGFRRLLFVVEQPGTIRVLRGSRTVGHPFLNIADLVEADGEQGLLSVAFPPDYEQSGRFYVYYTVRGGAANRVDELRRSGATTADPASRRTVIEIPHPDFANHNGGQLQFGPDGYLYIGPGDGGGGGDPDGNAQNPDSLLGKILRIDPRPGDAGAYGIPPDNPFAGATPGAGEVFALGLRNPWRFSFDRATDRVAIADVGQDEIEEIDYERFGDLRGANFGWDAFEGTQRFDEDTPAPPDHRPPIHEYSHAGGACSITGGYVVRDRRLKSLYGRYVYADFCAGELRSIVPKLGDGKKDRALGIDVPAISSFGEGRHGRIYAASLGGPVYRLKRP